MEISRRAMLIGLAAITPLSAGISVASAATSGADSDLLKVSRIIVGREDLQPAIAERVHKILETRIAEFPARLARLAAALGAGTDRDAALAALDDDNLDLALQIATPWYVGVAGSSNDHSFNDDAAFVTFLGAQAMALVADFVPMQSYSTGKPGWWAEPPAGVSPPPMPENIRDWTFQPDGATGQVLPADPAFLALVTPPARSNGN